MPQRHGTLAQQSSHRLKSFFCYQLEALLQRGVWDAGARPRARLTVRAQEGKGEGVVRGLRNWPPKPITEHGAPKPEDDPANYENGYVLTVIR